MGVVTDGSFIPEARCIGAFDARHTIEAPIQPRPIVACGWAVRSTWAAGRPPGDVVQGGCKARLRGSRGSSYASELVGVVEVLRWLDKWTALKDETGPHTTLGG